MPKFGGKGGLEIGSPGIGIWGFGWFAGFGNGMPGFCGKGWFEIGSPGIGGFGWYTGIGFGNGMPGFCGKGGFEFDAFLGIGGLFPGIEGKFLGIGGLLFPGNWGFEKGGSIGLGLFWGIWNPALIGFGNGIELDLGIGIFWIGRLPVWRIERGFEIAL